MNKTNGSFVDSSSLFCVSAHCKVAVCKPIWPYSLILADNDNNKNNAAMLLMLFSVLIEHNDASILSQEGAPGRVTAMSYP